uniref:NS protein n=1 Tax=Avian orthoreovirus TaxID=38170 RepID=A0A1J0M4Z2_9REOV|nr:NS protein [Avian orthoreovirus]
MLSLRHTTFDVKRFEFSPFILSECATPSFTVITDTDPAKYFNIEFPITHPLTPVVGDLLLRPCQVHVRLIRRFSLYSTLSDICEYDCALINSDDAIGALPSSSTHSRLVVHWDGRTHSITAKRSRRLDTLIDFEREYKSWRFDSTI